MSIILVVIIVIGVVAFTVYNTQSKTFVDTSDKQAHQEESTQEPTHETKRGFNIFPVVSNLPSCGTSNVMFTVSPLLDSDFTGITPLGNPNPSAHTFPTDHIYLHLRREGDINARVPVASPGNIHITKIGSTEHLNANPPFTDYSLDFSVCKEFRGKFGHIGSLSQKLLDAYQNPSDCDQYSTGGMDYKTCRKDVDIELISGENIGTIGGYVGSSAALDVWTYDFRTSAQTYSNPSRWNEEITYIVCPVDYFTPQIRDSMRAKLGDFSGNKRTIEPVCGEVAQDISGTAQGVWFVKGAVNTYPEDQHLALVHDNIYPRKLVFSIGTSTNIPSGAYYFTPSSSGQVNREFKDIISDGKIYCYDNLKDRFDKSSVSIILQLMSPTTLRIEGRGSTDCGNGPWSFASPTDFDR